MSSLLHTPAESTPEHSRFELIHVREMWASLAITAMWIAVACSAAWGPDFVSTTGGGTNSTTSPSGIAVALFASIGTWAVAKYGLGPQRKNIALVLAALCIVVARAATTGEA